MEQIQQSYFNSLGYLMAPSVRSTICQFLADGAGPDLICAVLAYTTETAPRPTWAYAKAVITKQLAAGVTTAAAFTAACDQWRAARAQPVQYGASSAQKAPKRVIEQCYNQREYDDSIDSIPADLLAAAKSK